MFHTYGTRLFRSLYTKVDCPNKNKSRRRCVKFGDDKKGLYKGPLESYDNSKIWPASLYKAEQVALHYLKSPDGLYKEYDDIPEAIWEAWHQGYNLYFDHYLMFWNEKIQVLKNKSDDGVFSAQNTCA